MHAIFHRDFVKCYNGATLEMFTKCLIEKFQHHLTKNSLLKNTGLNVPDGSHYFFVIIVKKTAPCLRQA
jgi:hypothetical protein